MFYKKIEISLPFIKDDNVLSKHRGFLFLLSCIFLFLTCANIFGIQKYYNIIFSLISLLFIISGKKLIIDIRFIITFTFSFFYMLFCTIQNGFHLNFIFYPLLILLIQQTIYSFPTNKAEKYLLIYLFVMASGFFLSFLLTISASIKHQGLLFNGGYLTTFWQNDEGGIINRTGLSLYGVGALSFATAYIFEKSKYRRIVYIILSVLLIVFIIAMSLIASNRALIVVCLFVLLFFVVKFMLKTSNKYVSISILIFIIVTFFLFFLIFSGLLRMPDWFYQIPIVKRFMSSDYNSDSSRLELYKVFFTNFYKYPFGGMNKLEGFTHVHNIVLDIYTYGGAIPFVLFFAFLLSYIYQLFKANKAKTIPIPIFALLLSFSLYTFGLGMFEPIYNANPNIMTPIFMIYFYVCYKSNKNDYYGSIDCKYYEVSI